MWRGLLYVAGLARWIPMIPPISVGAGSEISAGRLRHWGFLLVLITCAPSYLRAHDLVLHLSGGATHRIALIPESPSRVVGQDLYVSPIASSGVAGDGWCPMSGGSTPTGAGIVLAIDGSTVRIALGSAATIAPDTGDVHVTPSATTGAVGDGWCPVGSTPLPSFTTPLKATPASLPTAGNTTLSWVAANATGCVASATPSVAGWSGAKPVSGSVVVALSGAGNYVFNLTCTGAGGSRNAVPVTVTVGTPPVDCSNKPAPVGMSRQTSFNNTGDHAYNRDLPNGTISLLTYSPVLASFPSRETAYIPIVTGKYVALQFSTDGLSHGRYGEWDWEQPGWNGAPNMIALSPCPGDFNVATKCRLGPIGYGNLMWMVTTTGTSPSPTCPLQPNKVYYLNLMFADPATGSTLCTGQPYCNFMIGSDDYGTYTGN